MAPERKILMKGNDALCQGAIDAGCRFYAGYPITPQNETIEYMASHMEDSGGFFVQAESELAAINMVLGAAATGTRSMTTSSSPGISLMQEGISYIAGQRLPAVIANVVRGGPGLGNISAAQTDYFQSTRGGGHGGYRTPVLAPASVQEMYDFTFDAFEIADNYRNPTLILADGLLGQMAEPVTIGTKEAPPEIDKPWALTGAAGREPNAIYSLFVQHGRLEEHVRLLEQTYKEMQKEVRFEKIQCDDADALLVAYGTSARMCQKAVAIAREKGVRIGLFRPITLYPYPSQALRETIEGGVKDILTVEMSTGQMVEDVRLALCGSGVPVRFYGRTAGILPSPEGILAALEGKPEYGSFYQA